LQNFRLTSNKYVHVDLFAKKYRIEVMYRIKKKSLKSKALQSTINDVLKYVSNGVKIKTWHNIRKMFRMPTEEEFHTIIKHRRKFQGMTLQQFYDSRPDLQEKYTIYQLYQELIDSEIQQSNLSFKFKIYLDVKIPMLESRVTRQYLIEAYECLLDMHELYLGSPSNCSLLRYDKDNHATEIGKVFSTKPDEEKRINDLIELFKDSQSYMYCFSQTGYLRMIEYKIDCQQLSKHYNICEFDGPSCSAGVMIRRVNAIYVDRLSGTYKPTPENINSFESILKERFPFNHFIFKKEPLYLSGNYEYRDHPDF
tara:strand:+ start:1041 stop:1970 length:930 start_codon:yes stop_codon:yes gene_type:complete